jgi:hypothetical protein
VSVKAAGCAGIGDEGSMVKEETGAEPAWLTITLWLMLLAPVVLLAVSVTVYVPADEYA